MFKTYVFFIISYISTFALTFVGVERFRRWSLKKQIIDIPNDRSSHTQPTPRGGGLVIFFVCLAVFSVYCLLFDVFELYWAYFIGALIIGGISWIDDLLTISVIWRFLVHILAAFLVIYSFGFWEIVYIPFWGEIVFGKFGYLLTFLWIVWLINAYNFMDGIDGIAGGQAVSAGIGWLLVGLYLNIDDIGFYGAILAISSSGFLLHNWQPAKIFMGDIGSAFLGFTFAILPLMALKTASKTDVSVLPLMAVILVATFVFDSLWTFVKRLSRFEKVWKAHREHIYQELVIKGFSHSKVTIIYFGISVLSLVCLFVWLQNRQKIGDFPMAFIIIQLMFLLSYNLVKKD